MQVLRPRMQVYDMPSSVRCRGVQWGYRMLIGLGKTPGLSDGGAIARDDGLKKARTSVTVTGTYNCFILVALGACEGWRDNMWNASRMTLPRCVPTGRS